MSTCYTKAFWADLLTDKKNLALGFTIILITCTAVYKIFKSKNSTNTEKIETPLMFSVQSGDLKTVKHLVENGAKIHSCDLSNSVFTSDAAPEIIDYLIDNDAIIFGPCIISDGIPIFVCPPVVTTYWKKIHGQKYSQHFRALYHVKKYNVKKCNKENKHLLIDKDLLVDLLSTDLYSTTLTSDLEEMVSDLKNCPCCLRQRALAVLFARYKQNDPSLSSKKESLEELFGTVPFNESFLKDLHKVNAIKFMVQNNITDKFGRDALKACTQCCQDENVIDAIVANRFEQFGGQNNSHPKDARLFINNLGLKKKEIDKEDKEKTGKLEEILLYAKKRNKKVYNQLFKRTCFYAHINGKKLTRDGEVASQIVSFLDSRPTKEITEENENVIEQ